MADVAERDDALLQSLRRLAEDFERVTRHAAAELYRAYEHSAEGIPEQEVVFGLLARQATLAIGLLRSPQSWNGDMAPVILRTMIDLHLTLAWILQDPAPFRLTPVGSTRPRTCCITGAGSVGTSSSRHAGQPSLEP